MKWHSLKSISLEMWHQKWLKSHTCKVSQKTSGLTELTLPGQMEMGLASEPRGCTMCHLRVESLTFAYYYFAGRLGAHIHGDFHDRDVLQHPGERIHSTQKQLHEESLEYHGLHCCRFRVSDNFDAMVTVVNFKNFPTNYEWRVSNTAILAGLETT